MPDFQDGLFSVISHFYGFNQQRFFKFYLSTKSLYKNHPSTLLWHIFSHPALHFCLSSTRNDKKCALSERLLGFFLTSDFASFLPALRCFFRQDRLGIDSKSASIGQKILQNQSATKIPNSL
jgi:hypothetical protein